MFRNGICLLSLLTIHAVGCLSQAQEKKPTLAPFPSAGKGKRGIEWDARFLEDPNLFEVLSRTVTKDEITWALKLKADLNKLPMGLQLKLYALNTSLPLVGGCEVQFLDGDNNPIQTVRLLLKPAVTKRGQVTRPVLKLPKDDVLKKTRKVVFKE